MPFDTTGVYQYSPSDVVNSWHNLLNLGTSSISNVLKDVYAKTVIIASSHSDAMNKAGQLKTKGARISSASPVLVYRTDTRWFSLYDGVSLTSIAIPEPPLETINVTPVSSNFTVTNAKAYKQGRVHYVFLNARPTRTHRINAWSSVQAASIPAQYAPSEVMINLLPGSGTHAFMYSLNANGAINISSSETRDLALGNWTLHFTWIK